MLSWRFIMTMIKDFILKYDDKIIKTSFMLLPTILISLILIPMFVDNYTFNNYINGKTSHYIDILEALKYMILFAFAYMALTIIYNMLRQNVIDVNEIKVKSYFSMSLLLLSFGIFAAFSISIYTASNNYEARNIEFIENKLVDVKNSINNGTCVVANEIKDTAVEVSNCSTITNKMPGTLYYNKGGPFNSVSIKLDGSKQPTYSSGINEPEIVYRGYLGAFCRSLKNPDNRLLTEFSEIEALGENPLSDDFKIRWCEQYKGISQIVFTLKKNE